VVSVGEGEPEITKKSSGAQKKVNKRRSGVEATTTLSWEEKWTGKTAEQGVNSEDQKDSKRRRVQVSRTSQEVP